MRGTAARLHPGPRWPVLRFVKTAMDGPQRSPSRRSGRRPWRRSTTLAAPPTVAVAQALAAQLLDPAVQPESSPTSPVRQGAAVRPRATPPGPVPVGPFLPKGHALPRSRSCPTTGRIELRIARRPRRACRTSTWSRRGIEGPRSAELLEVAQSKEAAAANGGKAARPTRTPRTRNGGPRCRSFRRRAPGESAAPRPTCAPKRTRRSGQTRQSAPSPEIAHDSDRERADGRRTDPA